ncbi:MAG: DUF503 domain-containing protein [Proteobacteria bacterium]|nr:DUF503 domain-containing protein [Pseudomonadota bacterium]MCP4916065.1 DUF503 domain-containing protein [Pseudomonadota bacterium]
MRVGVLRLVLGIPGTASLKGKRQVLNKVRDRIRARFKVAIAEVEDQDVHDRIVLGVAVVGSDARVLRSILDKVVDFVESMGVARVEDDWVEISAFP